MERNERLEAVARSWVGTPWVDGSAVKGCGACCHLLIAEVYREAGWLPSLDVPKLPANAARYSNRSPMRAWLEREGEQYFEEVDRGFPLVHGELLLLRCGHVAHHIALYLEGGRALHVTATQGAMIVPVVPAWGRLLAHVYLPRLWEPKEQ